MAVQPFVKSVYQDLNESFSLGVSDVSFRKVYNERIQCRSTLPNECINFEIDGSKAPLVYLLKDMLFEFQIIITKKNKTPMTTMPEISVCNNLMHSLFCGFEMKVNNTIVTSDYNYMYKAYLLNLLSFDNLVKNTQMHMEGWYSDLATKFQDVKENAG